MGPGAGGSWGALPKMEAPTPPTEGPKTGNFGVGGAPSIELVGGYRHTQNSTHIIVRVQ